MKQEYVITISYDAEAGVYLGSCSDVRGLHVEGNSIEQVVEAVQDIMPDLVADNLVYDMKHGNPPLYRITTFAETRVQ